MTNPRDTRPQQAQPGRQPTDPQRPSRTDDPRTPGGNDEEE